MAKKGDPIVGGVSEAESAPWGQGSFANMPQEVKMASYPKMNYKSDMTLDDTAGRIADDAAKSHKADRSTLDRGMY